MEEGSNDAVAPTSSPSVRATTASYTKYSYLTSTLSWQADDDEAVSKPTGNASLQPDANMSGSSPESEQHHLPPSTPIAVRRQRRVARNRNYLMELGLHQSSRKKAKKEHKMETPLESPIVKRLGYGMLRPRKVSMAAPNSAPAFTDWKALFPHRQAEIATLTALIAAAFPSGLTGARPAARAHGPPAIWITGAPGTGKTAVVNAVIRAVPQLTTAYVHCGHFDAPHDLVQDIYTQLQRQISGKDSTKLHSKPRKTNTARDARAVPAARRTTRHGAASEPPGPATTLPAPTMLTSSISKTTLVHSFAHAVCNLIQNHDKTSPSITVVMDQADQHLHVVSQLLLVSDYRIPILFVVITNHQLLQHASIATHELPHGSLAQALQPVAIHFASYRTKTVLVDILQTENNACAIFGAATNSPFECAIRGSFVDVLVQSLMDATHDVRDYVRAGRTLWRCYIEPITGAAFVKTINAVRTSRNTAAGSVQLEIVAMLHQRLLPRIRQLLECDLYAFDEIAAKVNPTTQSLPTMSKLLLLAAYLCQHNKAEKDAILFNRDCGKRLKRQTLMQENAGEALAFGDDQHTPTSRLRPFALQRLLSVYTNLYCLSHSASDESNDGPAGDALQQMQMLSPTFDLSSSLAVLQNAGWLLATHKTSELQQLNDPRYTCLLTHEEATRIATSEHIDIEQYLS